MAEQIKVEGIREVRAQLKELYDGFDSALRQTYQRVANEVTDASQFRARAQGGTAAFVAPSIKTGSSVHAAVVNLGVGTLTRKDGTTVRASLVAPGAEFGSSYKQFKPWKGNGEEAGYFIYPTIRDMKPATVANAEEQFEQLIERVAPL